MMTHAQPPLVTLLEDDVRGLLNRLEHLQRQRDDLHARCNAYQEETRAQRTTIADLQAQLSSRPDDGAAQTA